MIRTNVMEEGNRPENHLNLLDEDFLEHYQQMNYLVRASH